MASEKIDAHQVVTKCCNDFLLPVPLTVRIGPLHGGSRRTLRTIAEHGLVMRDVIKKGERPISTTLASGSLCPASSFGLVQRHIGTVQRRIEGVRFMHQRQPKAGATVIQRCKAWQPCSDTLYQGLRLCHIQIAQGQGEFLRPDTGDEISFSHRAQQPLCKALQCERRHAPIA